MSEMESRACWDQYFINIASVVAMRATCPRRRVGAVIVKDKMIVSTGYNGSVRGSSHCDDIGCIMENGHCVATIHAEVNAILQAARNGISTLGTTMYITLNPCMSCYKLILNAGIVKVVCKEDTYQVSYDIPGLLCPNIVNRL
jgi:dCMP deaminase